MKKWLARKLIKIAFRLDNHPLIRIYDNLLNINSSNHNIFEKNVTINVSSRFYDLDERLRGTHHLLQDFIQEVKNKSGNNSTRSEVKIYDAVKIDNIIQIKFVYFEYSKFEECFKHDRSRIKNFLIENKLDYLCDLV
jgi:hypothetical protein